MKDAVGTTRPPVAIPAGPRPWQSLRVRLVALLLLVAAVPMGLRVSALIDGFHTMHRTARVQQVGQVGHALTEGVLALSLERSLTQVGMALPDPASAAAMALIERQRQMSAAALDRADATAAALAAELVEGVAGSASGGEAAFRRALSQARAEIGRARQTFDRALTQGKAARDAAESAGLIKEFKATVAGMHSLRLLLRGGMGATPDGVLTLERVRDAGWVLREYGGQERTYLAIATATRQPIGGEVLLEMAMLHARAADAWADIGQVMASGALAGEAMAPVRAAVEAIGRGYFGSYAKVREGLLGEAARPSPNYPQQFDAFFATSSTALEGVETLVRAANTAIGAAWDAEAAGGRRRSIVAATLLAIILAASAAAIVQQLWAMKRLGRLRDSMVTLAEAGDGDVPGTGAPDEIGEMARAVLVFRDQGRRRVAAEAQIAADRSRQDQRNASMQAHVQDFVQVISGVMSSLSESSSQMRISAGEMAAAADTTGAQAVQTTQGAHESSRHLSTVAAAVEQLSASVSEIAARLAESSSITNDAVKRTAQTNDSVQGLADAVGRIGAIATTIEGIAQKTKLLALNATIECARAGDAGRGFSVVASEVKSLAAQTAEATGQIAAQIADIESLTRRSVDNVSVLSASIRRVDEVAAAIAAAVEEQSATTREIASSVATVSAATAGAAQAMDTVTQAAGASQATAAGVTEAAGTVAEQAATLRTDVDQFLTAMREWEQERRGFCRETVSFGVTITSERGAQSAQVIDMSESGIGLGTDLGLPGGVLVHVMLPGESEPVGARVVFGQGGRTGLVFRLDNAHQVIVRRVLARAVPQEMRRAA